MDSDSTKKTLGILVGSLRRESYCKKVAEHLSGLLGAQFDIRFISLSDLSIYNQDFDTPENTPEAWQIFRMSVKTSGAILLVTPEYNRSIPPVLKNALDIASRPAGENVWSGKPAAIVSVSPGRIGGFGANHHLRQVSSFLNLYVMNQPEMYMGDIARMLGTEGIEDEKTQQYLQDFAKAFSDWIEAFN